jgi:PAS domain S-box-containing protein
MQYMGLQFEPDAEIGEKDSFRSATMQEKSMTASGDTKGTSRALSNPTAFPNPKKIRIEAEQKAKVIKPLSLECMNLEEIQQMVHELQVRQLEMKMQIEYLQSRPKEYDVQAELLTTITENMLDMIGLTDIEGNFIFAGKVHDVLGYESGFLVGKNVMDFVHPEDLSHLLQEFSQLLASGVSNPVEYRYRRMDGSYLWFETVGRAICDKNGTPHQIVFNARDISERKYAEEKLRHRLIYEKMLSRISSMAVQHESVERFIDDTVTIMGETLGISRAYLFEHHHERDSMDNTFEWCAPEVSPQKDTLQGLPAAAIPWWMVTLKEGGTICFSDIEDIPDQEAKEILRRQGICSILVVPLFVAGRYHGFMGFDECWYHRQWPEEDVEILLAISRIISEAVYKKQSEEEIKRERQQLLSIFNSIEESIYIADPETYEILYVNPKLANILQRDCVGGLCYKEFQGIDEPCAFCNNDIILKHKAQPTYWEYYNPKFEKHFSLVNRIIEWSDGRNVRFEMATDITERKRAEKEREKLQTQLFQSQKMESVGRLAGGVAHDFNNMLTIINGYAEMMTDVLSPSDPMHESAREIHGAGKRSAVIVRKLLAFARKQTIAPVPMNLNDSVSSMLKMLQRLIGENIDLLYKPGKDLWLVKKDFSQIDQILANLVVNARDAIVDIGKMTIETKNIEFDDEYCDCHAGFVPGQFVMLAVSDNGCGMDKHVLENLFEPFFTTKEIGQGTGLGLPMVYGIVKQNNGFVNVYSEVEKGTTFRIYFPRFLEEPDTSDIEKKKEPLLKGHGETILILEDELMVMNITRIMLEKLGYTVLTATTPSAAMTLAEAHNGNIDLLITDIVMPEMNGREFSNQLNTLYPDIKTLFMSGYTANVIAHHTVLDEGLNFIEKPFSTNKLAAKVSELLSVD